MKFQSDGNLVLYEGDTPKWHTHTFGNKDATLRISSTHPFLSVVNSKENILWSTSVTMKLKQDGSSAIAGKKATRVYAIENVGNMSQEHRLLLASLQGLMNRSGTQVYLFQGNRFAPGANDWMLQPHYIPDGLFDNVELFFDPLDMASALAGKAQVKCLAKIASFLPWTVNLATNISGLNDCLIVDTISHEFFKPRFAAVYDLAGPLFNPHGSNELANAAHSYRWVVENLWPKQSKSMLANFSNFRSHDLERDYAIANRIHVFWTPASASDTHRGKNDSDYSAELHGLIKYVMHHMPMNIPILGFWPAVRERTLSEISSGMSPTDPALAIGFEEYDGVKMAGTFGKFTWVTDHASNYSFHSKVNRKIPILKQKRKDLSKLMETAGKKYVALTLMESGDSPGYFQFAFHKNQWGDPLRGKVPLSYGITPSLLTLMPRLAEFLYESATPNDFFFASIGGLGYMYAFDNYGLHGTLNWPDTKPNVLAANQYDIIHDYYQRTAAVMKEMDLDMLGLYSHALNAGWNNPADDNYLRAFVLPKFSKLKSIVSDMGRLMYMGPENATRMLDANTSIFHCLSQWDTTAGEPFALHREHSDADDEAAANWLAQEIMKQGGNSRFFQAMAFSWHYNFKRLKRVQEILQAQGYLLVTLDELDDLMRKVPEQSRK